MTRVGGTRPQRLGWMLCRWLVVGMSAAACGVPRTPVRTVAPEARGTWSAARSLDLFAQHVFPPMRFGGLSGLAYDPVEGRWMAVSDARRDPLWLTMDVALRRGRVDVGIRRVVRARRRQGLGPAFPDFEAVTALPDGHLLVASEGDRVNGVRVPASIWEYDRRGRPLSQVAVPPAFLPEAPGKRPHGLGDNNGFEGLAFDPRARRVWLVSETPLLQDDDVARVDRGARARMLELSYAGGTSFSPVRELVYPIDAVGRIDGMPPDAEVVDQGVSELTMLPGGVLVSMERAFVRDAAAHWSANVVRIFRLDVSAADDVSGADSLRDVPAARPVRKHLLADLSTFTPRLDARLKTLENFEAMAPGPLTPDGRPTLLVLSDDNFSRSQVTALLVLVAQ